MGTIAHRPPTWLRRRGLLFVPLLLATPNPAQAHAILLASAPPAHGTVPAGPIAITLRFNSRIDRARSRLTLVRPDKSQAMLELSGPSDDVIEAAATLAPGAHLLRWQVLAIDGHITRGDLPFTVKAG
jgi:hypothetical protein